MKIWKQGTQRGQKLCPAPPQSMGQPRQTFEPTGTTRASIVGATRPPVGYYLELPNHLVGFADSIRRLFLGSVEYMVTGPSSGKLILTRVGERRFLKVGGKWARSQNGSSDSFQRKKSEQPRPKLTCRSHLSFLWQDRLGAAATPAGGIKLDTCHLSVAPRASTGSDGDCKAEK